MSPNLPVGGSAADLLSGLRTAAPDGLTQVGFGLRLTSINSRYSGNERFEVPGGQGISTGVGTLTLRHHFDAGWAAEANLPAGMVRFDPGQGGQITRGAGFGDLELALRFDFAEVWGRGGLHPSIVVRGSLTLPTGVPQVVARSPTSVAPYLLALGEGAFGLGLRVEGTQWIHKLFLVRGWLGLRGPLSPNPVQIDVGTQYSYGVGAVLVPVEWMLISAALDGSVRTLARKEDIGELINSGGHWIALAPSVGARIGQRATFSIFGRLPLYTNVQGEQISETFTIGTQVVLTFGQSDTEKEHQQHHVPEGAPPPEAQAPAVPGAPQVARFADAATGGADFDPGATVVRGKVTVIEFWAEWCRPCLEIGEALRTLTESEPDLVVRRVEVPDLGSAVARRHLRDVPGLPVVWVHDRAGKRTTELVGATPAEVLAKVDALLRAER